jgi:phosphate starvation-inducible PhoH-like protein
MAKRSMRSKSRASSYASQENVHPLFPVRSNHHGAGWTPHDPDGQFRDRKYVKNIRAMSPAQQQFMDAIDAQSVVLALGPAGTGKTYLAIAKAVEALEAGKVQRIVLSRPAVEAGENLGFLPGDLTEKLAPYLRPLYDALTERLGTKRLKQMLADGIIEIAPVAYMRGRTLSECFVVIDEAQNCTYTQIKMLLTRLGWRSTMVLTGDPDQTDLLPGISGLADIASRLERVPDIPVVRLAEGDIVRHPLVAAMLTVL